MNKEYIERDALKRFPIRLNHYDKEHGNEHFVLGIESVLEYAESLPAADVVPVQHGYWIEKRWVTECDWCDFHHRSITCSVCKKETYEGKETPYCPDCGAKMDGGK